MPGDTPDNHFIRRYITSVDLSGVLMTFENILILITISYLNRSLFKGNNKTLALLVISIFFIYWLQPASAIRNLDFWLPTLTITLTIICWVVVSNHSSSFRKDDFQSLFLTFGIILLIASLRYFNLNLYITQTKPPEMQWIILFLISTFFILIRLQRNKESTSPFFTSLLIIIIIGVLIILKNPILSFKLSLVIRQIIGQSTSEELIKASDIRWLGYSYIAFRLIHILRDRQLNTCDQIDLKTFLTYVLFFPAVVAGPIERIQKFNKEINKDIESDDLIIGMKRIFIGMGRKFIIADSLAIIALNEHSAFQVTSSFWLWVMIFAYSLMIYFDFSGYTDIAIGLSKLSGISLSENFDRPYFSLNITQFWNRWHITLTQWFRAYFFNPLTRFMRSRKKSIPTFAIILLTQVSTMVLIGLWHGITWNFIFWGIWHGIGIFLQNRWTNWIKSIPPQNFMSNPIIQILVNASSMLLTFCFVSLGWIWFALPETNQGIGVFIRLFGYK